MQMAWAAGHILAASVADQSAIDFALISINAGILILPMLVNPKGSKKVPDTAYKCLHLCMILCYRGTLAQSTDTLTPQPLTPDTHPTTTHSWCCTWNLHREPQRTDCAVQRMAAAVLMAAALAVSMVSSAFALLDTNPHSPVPRLYSLSIQQFVCAGCHVSACV